jgi:hypothetical protein
LSGDRIKEAYACLRQIFPKKCEAKLKEGIFVDAQIKVLEDHYYNLQKEETVGHLAMSAENP